MNVLITGITGFVGSHMAEYLLKMKDVKVWGIDRWRSKKDNIEHLMDKINLLECDLRDASSVEKTIQQIKPEKIFHLAAQSFVPTSWNAPAETITTNIIGQLNIFEACLKVGVNPFIQIACSSEEYGMVKPEETPIKETNPLRPLSPYGVSKVGQDLLGYQYAMSYKLNIIRTRGFNHTGPRRGEVFVESNFAQQIARIEKGKQDPVIHVGDLTARRDYTDARDMVKGYWLATEKCIPGEVYNICRGKDWTIQKVLDILLSYSKIKVTVKQDPSRMRPSDVKILLGDNTKFYNQTGWKPEIPFETTLLDLLNYWRERV
ncbi:MAG TPA: GDP-mannose 4,6-dehydratase [Elusimicrobia bacterium]|nr:MAG: GDP-mannose 4,6-dehydratase [Elusimicrobia bacterium RIFOXYA12_FULL_49_49]OGS09794.1 MAG: GDP-mannose 4,6-dehydratase [Elusimicrobia bacterium RIFOXYA1_FULL_47_7]OGS10812.1 MAG: GDP-mannose 4,6-dehydratase [Elusimicrobia bacterium RIFOXYB1_FULL_48_9]OGS16829.1 MAG: GDP-mannose 4,6-dehydratase [Elusimicrobia bacterium RIFOXYA2_FULL_47_53]OGS32057.1 MAG: GDP-mannose 4,6-dehydratase [Elusimicrobia bacterium RIFOXYB2_FULL_46_23]HBU69950.1 GDP-mannose 4,6-dehydratase [Elusimicrobiota bacter